MDKRYCVLGERLKEKFGSEVIEYYHGQKLPVTMFDALIQVNKAHVVMLVEKGVVGPQEGSAILQALLELEKMGEERFQIDPYLVDLYMNMEAFVTTRVGEDIGGKMHTARSRNDLEVTSLRIALRAGINEILGRIIELREILIQRAEQHSDTIMPAYTHMQHAQPITLGHYLLAVADIFERDILRLEDAYGRVNLNPLGACALATTGFPIDRDRTTELMGFDGIVENSLDAISSQDFAHEIVGALVIMLTNLSRLAMDLILWSTHEYDMIEMADRYASVSSIMPQKKNPVMAEAMRGSVSRVCASLQRIQTALKALPHGVCTDFDEISEASRDAMHEASSILKVAAGVLATLTVRKEVMERRAGEGFTTATELADVIVRERRLAFRTAHRIVGAVVRHAIEKGKELPYITTETIDEEAMRIIGNRLDLDKETVSRALDPHENVRRRDVKGGPAPVEVMRMIGDRKKRIIEEKGRSECRAKRLEKAVERLSEAVGVVLERRDQIPC